MKQRIETYEQAQFRQKKERKMLFARCLPQEPSYKIYPHTFQKNVGIVRGQFYDRKGKLTQLSYGTGIAITKRLVLTSAHTFFNQNKQLTCKSVSFVPGHTKGYIKQSEKIYKSTRDDFLFMDNLSDDQNYRRQPLAKDVALIYLSEDLPLDSFPRVGGQTDKGIKVTIMGYPSVNFSNDTDLRNVQATRSDLVGQIRKIKSHVVSYNLNTEKGHSGSALFASSASAGQDFIIGVHTHRNDLYSSGVFFTKNILQKLAQWEKISNQKHRSSEQINFSSRIFNIRQEKKLFECQKQETLTDFVQKNITFKNLKEKNVLPEQNQRKNWNKNTQCCQSYQESKQNQIETQVKREDVQAKDQKREIQEPIFYIRQNKCEQEDDYDQFYQNMMQQYLLVNSEYFKVVKR